MKCVHVAWVDSQTDNGWDGFEPSDKLDLCHTVAFLVAETEHYVVVAHSYDPATDEWNGRMSIPICAIVELRVLCRIKT